MTNQLDKHILAVDAHQYMPSTVPVSRLSAVPSVAFPWHSHSALYLLLLVNSFGPLLCFSQARKEVIFSEVPLLLPLPSLKCLNTP